MTILDKTHKLTILMTKNITSKIKRIAKNLFASNLGTMCHPSTFTEYAKTPYLVSLNQFFLRRITNVNDIIQNEDVSR